MLDHLLTLDRPIRNVEVTWAPSSRQSSDEIEHAIESAWQAKATQPGVNLFDGPMCRLEGYQRLGDTVHLTLSTTSYRVFLGTNLYGNRSWPIEALSNPIGVSPALITTDGKLAFGIRNASVAYYPHRLHPFSGALEPPTGGLPLDIFAESRRELGEELHLAAEEISDLALLGIVRDRDIRHPELILYAKTSLASDELRNRVDPDEHCGIVFIDSADGFAGATIPCEPTPVATAAMTLFVTLMR